MAMSRMKGSVFDLRPPRIYNSGLESFAATDFWPTTKAAASRAPSTPSAIDRPVLVDERLADPPS